MFFVQGDLWWLGGVLYIIANLTFGAAMVFYNSYLPDIASEDQRDRVSSYGWAMGYLGGGLLLVLNLAFYLMREKLGVPTGLAVRINLASAGVWWLGWALITWALMMEGGVQLNARGQRFHDETAGYSEAAVQVLAQPISDPLPVAVEIRLPGSLTADALPALSPGPRGPLA